MFRQYENPHDLEERLAQRKVDAAHCQETEALLYIMEDIWELEERIRFAWDDIEYDQCAV